MRPGVSNCPPETEAPGSQRKPHPNHSLCRPWLPRTQTRPEMQTEVSPTLLVSDYCCSWWVACVRARLLRHVQLFGTLQIIAHQAPLPMEFSRQEYWSGLPCPSPGDLPDPRTEPTSLAPPALPGRLSTTMPSGKPQSWQLLSKYLLTK